MGFSFTSQGCLTAAESILKSADKIAELLESFEQAKQSIMSNYSSEAASAIETAFTKIQNNGPEFHDAVEQCSKYLSEVVAPNYAALEKKATELGG